MADDIKPVFGFERLEVWELAVDLADFVYELTLKFPDDERFGLSSQLRRAAVSVSANTAEGNGRATKADYANFVSIAHGSLMEVVSLARIAHRRHYISDSNHQRLRNESAHIGLKLHGLRSYLTK